HRPASKPSRSVLEHAVPARVGPNVACPCAFKRHRHASYPQGLRVRNPFCGGRRGMETTEPRRASLALQSVSARSSNLLLVPQHPLFVNRFVCSSKAHPHGQKQKTSLGGSPAQRRNTVPSARNDQM